MIKVKEKIKKIFGEILLIIGAFITSYNMLNFSSDRECGFSLIGFDRECDKPVKYFYTGGVRLMVSIGLILFLIGILVIRHNDKK